MITHLKRRLKMPKLPPPSSREPVPAATYKVKIKKYEHGHSKKKGTPQITWIAEIIDGEFSGRSLYDRTIMVDTSVWRVSNLLGSCGLVFSSGMDTDSAFFEELCAAALGRTSFWRVEEKTLENGNVINEIMDYRNDEDQETLEVTEPKEATPAWVEEG